MKYSEIGLALKSEDGGQVETAFDAAGSGTYRLSAEPEYEAGTAKKGTKVASGTITSSTTETTHNYKLTMWVNKTVTISDTDAATYRASDVETGPNSEKEVYSNLYYSLKVNVEANA